VHRRLISSHLNVDVTHVRLVSSGSHSLFHHVRICTSPVPLRMWRHVYVDASSLVSCLFHITNRHKYVRNNTFICWLLITENKNIYYLIPYYVNIKPNKFNEYEIQYFVLRHWIFLTVLFLQRFMSTQLWR